MEGHVDLVTHDLHRVDATKVFDTYDKTAADGGQYYADQAKIAQKDTVAGVIAQATLDPSKCSLNKAQEDIKASQQAVQSYAERPAQVMNNVAYI